MDQHDDVVSGSAGDDRGPSSARPTAARGSKRARRSGTNVSARTGLLATLAVTMVLFGAVACGKADDTAANGGGGGATGTTVGTAKTATTKAGTPPTTRGVSNVGCFNKAWPTLYLGEAPEMKTDTTPMFYVWRDNEGWHIRGRGEEKGTDMKVIVTSAGQLQAAHFKADSPDGGKLDVVKNTATFTVKGTNKLNGFDFAGCYIEEMTISIFGNNDVQWPVQYIIAGKGNHPLDDPIKVARADK